MFKRAISTLTLLAAAVAAAAAGPATAAATGTDEAAARAATSGYHRTGTARQDGYALPPSGPLHECISAPNSSGAAMGFHWINADLVTDATLDPTRPEALVYEPTKNGGLRLVALEYVVFADVWEAAHPGTTPELFGQPLSYVGEPNRFGLPAFYELHAWVWKSNPDGTFADHNPRSSCRFATRVDR